ncbi:hypothetical protein M3212_12120 [Alkalihalobacillus oceani]|uniref:hypothetical protein n=1 Tax=Halalkalibacter oceani TaxID=1653776 RepID=UPI00203D0014|nr:hypothetical protein [Halalkalibacter oceani]MCM3761531.1 hypothetical protein [Halalkalibacter oceani]
MKRLMVQVIVTGTILLLGALAGVQYMNEQLGITQPVPLTVPENVPEETEAAAPSLSKQELAAKYERVEQVGRLNFFSEMGTSLADGMNKLSRSFLSQIMAFVRQVLNGEEAA